jgi:hypothetical protein
LYNKDYKFLNKYSSDFRNYLIFGDDITKNKDIIEPKEFNDVLFKESGYAFLYDHINKAKLSFDFGEIGDKISAAHGHSDIFHFTFDIDGVPVLVDSGTYQYHNKYNIWRKYFRGLSAHNTISINKKDHAVQASRMSWFGKPKTKLLDYFISDTKSYIEAETNAFKKENIIHIRKLIFEKENKVITIIDTLKKITESNDNYTYCLYFNFDNNTRLIHEKNKIQVNLGSRNITLENSEFNSAKTLLASSENCIGWRSPNYNAKNPGQVVILEASSKENIKLITSIYY